MSILKAILEIILKLIPRWIKNKEDKENLEKAIKGKIESCEESAGSAARIRDVEVAEDADLEKKWAEKWGEKPKPAPAPAQPQPAPEQPAPTKPSAPDVLTIDAPQEVYADNEFPIVLSKPVPGASVFADDYRLYESISNARFFVTLTVPGDRKIRVVQNGTELASCIVRVVR